MGVQNFGQRARGIPGKPGACPRKPSFYLHFIVTQSTVCETNIVYRYTSTQKYLYTKIQKG